MNIKTILKSLSKKQKKIRNIVYRVCGIGMIAFVAGIFAALILPIWLLAAIEGALLILLGCTLLRF